MIFSRQNINIGLIERFTSLLGILPHTGVSLQINDKLHALSGIKTVVNNNEILTIPTQYEYNVTNIEIDGTVNIDGSLNII